MSRLEQFLEVKNSTETSVDLHFYGDIVSDWMDAWTSEDKYPSIIKNFLGNAKGKDLNIYINSAGGSVFAGMAIYNMLKRHTGHKKVIVDGLAASISSVIALAGDEIEVPENAYIMIHKPWCSCQGNSDDFKARYEMLEKTEEGIVSVYKENMVDGIEIDDIRNMMKEETWMTGNEASKVFKKISVSKPLDVLNCVSDIEFRNIPESIKNVKDALDEEKEQEEIEKIMMEIELL